jgi:hypothetical protein
MSRQFCRRIRPAPVLLSRRQSSARQFGELVQLARERDGRPLEELAPLTGLTVPGWEAIEAGQVPDTWEQVCLIVSALHLGRIWRRYLLDRYVGAKQ